MTTNHQGASRPLTGQAKSFMGRTVEYTMHFTYDANGTPLTVIFDCVFYDEERIFDETTGAYADDVEIWYIESETYYYITNIQGDVIELLNSDGEIAGHYVYNAWGAEMDSYGAGEIVYYNPLRYRGYFLDPVSNLYYLQTRFYDPSVGRFINADDIDYLGADGTPLSYNLFAYCNNNPVMRYDPTGNWSWNKQIFVGLAIFAVGLSIIAAVPTGGASLVVGTVAISSSMVISAGGALAATGAIISGEALIKSNNSANFNTFTMTESFSANVTQVKTKGKENVRDTGLAHESDAEVRRKAHDNRLSKAERQRYQKEEKARKYRNMTKRRGR